MRSSGFVGLVALFACGCTALLDLEAPARRPPDAAPGADAPRIDAAVVDADLDASTPDALACPASYTSIGGSAMRYRFVTTQTSWLAAAADCAKDGGTTHLVVLNSSQEASMLYTLTTERAWVGASDLVTEGTFLWVTTDPGAIASQQVSGNSLGDDCVQLELSGARAQNCGVNNDYVCECDSYANDPTRY